MRAFFLPRQCQPYLPTQGSQEGRANLEFGRAILDANTVMVIQGFCLYSLKNMNSNEILATLDGTKKVIFSVLEHSWGLLEFDPCDLRLQYW